MHQSDGLGGEKFAVWAYERDLRSSVLNSCLLGHLQRRGTHLGCVLAITRREGARTKEGFWGVAAPTHAGSDVTSFSGSARVLSTSVL